MLNDKATINAKGHVKLELYNEEGTFYRKEKKNLVVQTANEIIANMLADPSKTIRVAQKDKGATALVASAKGFGFGLSVAHEKVVTYTNNFGSTNVAVDYELEQLKNLVSIQSITVNGVELVLNKDVFVKDPLKGKLHFVVAPLEAMVIKASVVANPYMNVIEGTEKVKVAGVDYTRADVANDVSKTYVLDAKNGMIYFETAKTLVVAEYEYAMNYSLGFMALGGKPSAGWTNYKPVEFGESDKLKTFMENELPDSRMVIQHPSSISHGATELDPAIPTQPISTVAKKESVTVILATDGVSKQLEYAVTNTHNTGTGLTGRLLLNLVKVTNTTTGANILAGTKVKENTVAGIKLQLTDADVNENDVIEAEYTLKLDNNHLTYQLSQAPVVKLLSVRHINSLDPTDIREYAINNSGLVPNQGDVWISNSGTGHITFSAAPIGANPAKPAPQVQTPGQLQIEYQVNSGTTVKFVADFGKGVPAPKVENDKKIEVVAAGQTSVVLPQAIAKDENGAYLEPVIKVDSATLTPSDYTISLDGKTLTFKAINAGQSVVVDYKFLKETHDIYQVAMFDEKVGGKMFNISGIGPVTKDKNTGMRITWSVTF